MPGRTDGGRTARSTATGPLRELPLIRQPDVDNYDACYLPDGRIIFSSTACFTGVPCVAAPGTCATLPAGNSTGDPATHRRAGPRLVSHGAQQRPDTLSPLGVHRPAARLLADPLLTWTRTARGKSEYYGSNSYWPASMFYARPIPGHPTKVVAVVGGHHEQPRMGDLVIFDPARGRAEADGAVQRIPGRGRKVEPVMLDLPIAQTWPKFLHPSR